jgi:hypothetical protein
MWHLDAMNHSAETCDLGTMTLESKRRNKSMRDPNINSTKEPKCKKDDGVLQAILKPHDSEMYLLI